MRRALLLLVGDVPAERLRAALPDPPARIHVVAPMVLGAADWLATAEDDERHRAEVRVLEAEWVLHDEAEVDGEAGESDPVQAVEDALRRFDADGILIAGDAAPGLEDELAAYGLPVERLEPAPPPRSWAARALRSLAGGRRNGTPFVLFVGVNGALLLLAASISALALAVLWATGRL
jgi:hypothetical protein